MNEKNRSKSQKLIKKEKFIKTYIKSNKNKKQKKERFVNSINNNIQYDSENIIVEIQNEQENTKKNDIIDLDESSTEQNNIPGKKTEVKYARKRRKVLNGHKFKGKYGLKSESKISNSVKQLEKKEESKLSYHYSLNQGNIYKYKFININDKENKAIFFCDDLKCNARAEYCLNDKVFVLNVGHNIEHSEHDYIKSMNLLCQ